MARVCRRIYSEFISPESTIGGSSSFSIIKIIRLRGEHWRWRVNFGLVPNDLRKKFIKINKALNHSPVVNLKDRQPRVLCQLLFLVFRGVGMLQAERMSSLRYSRVLE